MKTARAINANGNARSHQSWHMPTGANCPVLSISDTKFIDLGFLVSVKKNMKSTSFADRQIHNINGQYLISETMRVSDKLSEKSMCNNIANNQQAKVVMVCSIKDREQAKQVLLRFANDASVSGGRVLILDCDLRESAFGQNWNGKLALGVSDLMHRKLPVDPVPQTTQIPNVDYMPSGCLSVNPISTLMSTEFISFLANIKVKYDTILINVPPYQQAVDAFVLAKFSKPTVVLVSGPDTDARILSNVLDELAVLDLEVRIEPATK